MSLLLSLQDPKKLFDPRTTHTHTYTTTHMHSLEQLVAIHSNGATGMQDRDKRTFVV